MVMASRRIASICSFESFLLGSSPLPPPWRFFSSSGKPGGSRFSIREDDFAWRVALPRAAFGGTALDGPAFDAADFPADGLAGGVGVAAAGGAGCLVGFFFISTRPQSAK